MLQRWMGTAAMGMALVLAGCASHPKSTAGVTPPQNEVDADGRDARGDYRFEMTQHGRKMDADAFDAWMKERGIRVAKGKPAAKSATPAAVASSQATPAKAKNAKARRKGEG